MGKTLKLSPQDRHFLNQWEGFISLKPTWLYQQFLLREEKIICLFTGNQVGKTAQVAHSYVMRIIGIHPVERKNLRPNNPIRTFRFASECLPNDPDGGEVKNTQYPAFKKWLPPELIKKDITIRKSVMTLHDPQGGPDIYVEFVSYNQAVQTQAGVQRFSTWEDESAPKAFHEEQIPRLLAANGDIIYTLTPAESMTWEFDEFYERAKVYIRTPAVVQRIKKRLRKDVPLIEYTDSKDDIAVLQAATDDNPTLDPKAVEALYATYDDENVIDIRRFGLFRQVSGQIFKDFDLRIHVIEQEKYFPEGVYPDRWNFARAIDYHEFNNWACMSAMLSTDDEVFIFDEFSPSPEQYVTLEIAKRLSLQGGDYNYYLNLVDPLAAKKQPNTGFTVIQDLNRLFSEYKKQGLGTGGYWQSWDTKSTRGRDEIRKRLKNSKLVGKPFSNKFIKKGRAYRLPTLWIMKGCKETVLSFKNWRKEEWANRNHLIGKDQKEAVQQKWSHYCMCLEALFKHQAFIVQPPRKIVQHTKTYMKGKNRRKRRA